MVVVVVIVKVAALAALVAVVKDVVLYVIYARLLYTRPADCNFVLNCFQQLNTT